MAGIQANHLMKLAGKTDRIRNVCVLAHVDHGKTTLCDHLIATNGILSARNAGTARYMDSREDEQLRQITMKSSCISLIYRRSPGPLGAERSEDDAREPLPQALAKSGLFLVNLIDSPGHVDFTNEVSSAVRLSDGAIVLVDTLEGVCAQTVAVLRQAWNERLEPILLLNKLDRLITELKMSPAEAYEHLTRILEHVNVITAQLAAEEAHSEVHAASAEVHLDDSKKMYFHPSLGNVIFGSTGDGWCFSTLQIASLVAPKLGIDVGSLEKAFWGDWYFHKKTRRLTQKRPSRTSQPVFVQFALDTVWNIYNVVLNTRQPDRLQRVVEVLGLDVTEALSFSDPHQQLCYIMSKWIPVADCVLSAVVDSVPSPVTAHKFRLPCLWPVAAEPNRTSDESHLYESCSQARCDPASPLLVYVAKIVAVPIALVPPDLPDLGRSAADPLGLPRDDPEGPPLRCVPKTWCLDGWSGDMTSESPSGANLAPMSAPSAAPTVALIALARVFSGLLTTSSTVYIMGPKYQPSVPWENQPESLFRASGLRLFQMSGADLRSVTSVPCGAICAIGGLGSMLSKTGTLASTICRPFVDLRLQASPVVQVAVEPVSASDLPTLQRALRLLDRADASVAIGVLRTGEHVIGACGELHLEVCLNLLRDQFCPDVELLVSDPIVNFRETLAPATDTGAQSCPTAKFWTRNEKCFLQVSTFPLHADVVSHLEAHGARLASQAVPQLASGGPELASLLQARHPEYSLEPSHLWAVGPLEIPLNVLICKSAALSRLALQGSGDATQLHHTKPRPEDELQFQLLQTVGAERMVSAILSGFQQASEAGTLANEPIQGVMFVLEECEMLPDDIAAPVAMAGMVAFTLRNAWRASFARQGPRLVQSLQHMKLVVPSNVLNQLDGAISKRGGRIVSSDIKEGTNSFVVHAEVPTATSFGLADDLRVSTSSNISPQYLSSLWATIDQDPFWTPTTVEEREEWGEQGVRGTNRARELVDSIRRRKGLVVYNDLHAFED